MNNNTSRLESSAFVVFVITILLTPLVFVPSAYSTLDAAKSFVVVIGLVVSAILYGLACLKARSVVLPPKNIIISGLAVAIITLISALASGAVGKSLFGQGFEIGTASFSLIVFVGALLAFAMVTGRSHRIFVLYTAIGAPIVILYAFHLLRFIFGSGFMGLGFLNNLTDTVFGTWHGLGIASIILAIISVCMLLFFQLKGRGRVLIWVLFALSAIGSFAAADVSTLTLSAIIFAALAVYASLMNFKAVEMAGRTWFRKISWLPLIACAVGVVLSLQYNNIVNPVINKIGAQSQELRLPWQLTMDVTTGVLKDHPVLGIGPNRFVQAYTAHKPLIVNVTDAWNIDFAYGSGFLPTQVSAIGGLGTVAWLVFLIFLVIACVRSLRKLPPDSPWLKTVIVSSWSVTIFLWLSSITHILSHSLLLYAFLFTGIAIATGVLSGSVSSFNLTPISERGKKAFGVSFLVFIVILAAWGLSQIRSTVALAYFSSGLSELTKVSGIVNADEDFRIANAIDKSDVYLRARAEAGIAAVSFLVNQSSTATSSEAVKEIAGKVSSIINQSLLYSREAIVLDGANYYNYVSEARVSEAATQLNMKDAYENTVAAYNKAIGLYPSNPSLYVSLARIYALSGKYEEARQATAAAFQLKNNYIEAVFQFGLIQYIEKNYSGAADTFGKAVQAQNDYANARYFLGLSYARLGKNREAIDQFDELARTNPDNAEVKFILENLKAGKSPFADAQPPITPTPEKRAELPIKPKKK